MNGKVTLPALHIVGFWNASVVQVAINLSGLATSSIWWTQFALFCLLHKACLLVSWGLSRLLCVCLNWESGLLTLNFTGHEASRDPNLVRDTLVLPWRDLGWWLNSIFLRLVDFVVIVVHGPDNLIVLDNCCLQRLSSWNNKVHFCLRHRDNWKLLVWVSLLILFNWGA